MRVPNRLCLLVLTGCFLGTGIQSAKAAEGVLLDVARRQIPDDTGNDDQTRLTIAKLPALGGNALKVEFGPGDSFGDRLARVKNWTTYSRIQFDVFNPSEESVVIELNVNHARTKDVSTRVIEEITIPPGKQTIRISLRDLMNSNGTAPDLANVVRWYLASQEGQSPTLYFGNLMLESGELPAAPPAPAPVNASSSLPTGGA